jgi:FtsP/CotA-like multicopper oxidase with cupredoxin domain
MDATSPASPLRRLVPVLVCSLVAVTACTAGQPRSATADPFAQVLTALPPNTPELRQPRLIESRPVTVAGRQDRVLDATLEVVLRALPVPQPNGTTKTLTLRTYRVTEANGVSWLNGDSVGFPGPTFRVRPGDSVSIRLINNLPLTGNDSSCVNGGSADNPPNCFHGINWTNIHYHGFHVSPSPNADDVLMQIAPNGGRFQYGFRIPRTQSPGTHWYHPHKHGSVAIQVINGMSGAFEVVDPTTGLDRMQAENHISERLLAFQQISDTLNLMSGAGGVPATLVNGQYRPVITMQRGSTERWRIVNENVTKSASFSLSFPDLPGEEPQAYEIARDGVAYAPVNFLSKPADRDTALFMGPGNRLDVLMKAPPRTGLFQATITLVEHLEAEEDSSRKRPRLVGAAPGEPGAVPKTLVFFVNVVDPAPGERSTFPAALPPLPPFLNTLAGPLDSIMPPDSTEVVVFTARGATSGTPDFFLGNQQYPLQQFNPGSVFVPRTGAGAGVANPMHLDSTQTWKVVNTDNKTNHPFHIHVNPFQVVYVHAPNANDQYQTLYKRLNAASQTNRSPIWLDVLPLPTSTATDTAYVLIRQQYTEFPGWYVMHCHILGHEEQGMMQVLQVVAPGDTVRPPPPSVTNPTQSGAASHRH